jgi:hypothetical protein
VVVVVGAEVVVVVEPASHAPTCSRHAPACRRKQSFGYVVPSQPHTGATKSGQTSGFTAQVPAVLLHVPAAH